MVSLKRFFGTGRRGRDSLPRDSKGRRRPYPKQIEVDDKWDRLEDAELRYWKEKATKLEGRLRKLEATVVSLQQEDGEEGQRRDPSKSAPVVAGSRPATPETSTSSPSLETRQITPRIKEAEIEKHKKSDDRQRQRKDEIMKQLVSEMERIVRLKTTTVDEENGNGDTTIIDASALEEIVTKALAAEKKEKRAGRKHRHRPPPNVSDFYQLSCKHCVGQNFVGSTKSDICDKVREHYSVVWQVVQTAYGKGDGESVVTEGSLPFKASSFSHHLARHCRDCNKEREVHMWCLNNVKVERMGKRSLREIGD